MGLFGSSANKSEARKGIDWMELKDMGQLDELIEVSKQKPVLIFKHSTRCAISRFALKQFESDYAIADEEAVPYFLDLLEQRSLSNEIASRFGVTHQSPQLILIKDGRAIYQASHSDISAEDTASQISRDLG